MGGIKNNTIYGSNVDFTGSASPAPTMTTDGNLLIASTAAPNIKVGALTSPLGTLNIGYSTPNITLDVTGFAASSLSPYIVGTIGFSDYTTIQAAINAAVSAGASNSSPAKIYVKQGTYTENLTLADGIIIIGFDQDYGGTSPNKSVKVVGTVTLTSGTAKLQSIYLQSTSTAITQSGGTLYLENFSATVTGANFLLYTTVANKFTYLNNCILTGDGSFISDNSFAFDVELNAYNSYINFSSSVSTLDAAAAQYFLDFEYCTIITSFNLSGLDPSALTFGYCKHASISASTLVTVGTNPVTLNYNFCELIPSTTPFSLGNNTTQFIKQCQFGSSNYATFADNLGVSSFTSDDGLVFRGDLLGYARSQKVTKQAATTTSGTDILINEILPLNCIFTMEGVVLGINPDIEEPIFGRFYACALRQNTTSVFLIGLPIIDIESVFNNSIISIADNDSTGALELTVASGVAGEYKWVATYDVYTNFGL